MRVLVINGPNLNLLGTREPAVYGNTSLAELDAKVAEWGRARGVDVESFQSNSEAEIIDRIQTSKFDAVIINPGALTHTSRAISDAIRSSDMPVVEVHISNIREREPWRAVSVVADACARSIYGRDLIGYRDALFHLVNLAEMPFKAVRYGPDSDNIGDLRGEGQTLVVLAHGGIWRHEFQRDTTESIAVDLAKRGFATWNLEYRRLGTGGGWPGSGHDVLTALDHIPHLGLKPERVVVIGHSAGAHLMMWAAQRSQTPVDLQISIAGIYDLQTVIEANGVGTRECRLMLDMGAPAQLTPGQVMTVLAHGHDDQISAVTQSVSLARAEGLELIRTGSGHFEWLDPTKTEWRLIVDRVERT